MIINAGSGIDTSDATATPDKILTGETAYVDGEKITGTMLYQGEYDVALSATITSWSIPKGYHDGNGSVSVKTQELVVTPSESQQIATPASGYVLSKVTVDAIPSDYKVVKVETKTLSNQTFVSLSRIDGKTPSMVAVIREGVEDLSTSYKTVLNSVVNGSSLNWHFTLFWYGDISYWKSGTVTGVTVSDSNVLIHAGNMTGDSNARFDGTYTFYIVY